MTNFEKVIQFCKLAGQKVENYPVYHYDTFQRRKNVISEEYKELMLELESEKPNFSKIAGELADLLYVVYGTAAELGIDIDQVFNTVHSNNMNKFMTNVTDAELSYNHYAFLNEKCSIVKKEYNNKQYFILLREDGKVLKPVFYKKDEVVAFSLVDLLYKATDTKLHKATDTKPETEKSIFEREVSEVKNSWEKAYNFLKNIVTKPSSLTNTKIPRRIARLEGSRADKRKKNRFFRRQRG